jgi:Cft2 family RNA processing exonuclease
MDVTLDTWKALYTRQDIADLYQRIVRVNYYQVFNTERGLELRCLPSGHNNGSCIWEVRSVQTHQKILLVNSMAQFSWRSCLSYNLERIAQSHRE